MPIQINLSDLLGPFALTVGLLVVAFVLWAWVRKLIDDRFKESQKALDLVNEALKDCHRNHEELGKLVAELSKSNAALNAKVEVLEKVKIPFDLEDIEKVLRKGMADLVHSELFKRP